MMAIKNSLPPGQLEVRPGVHNLMMADDNFSHFIFQSIKQHTASRPPMSNHLTTYKYNMRSIWIYTDAGRLKTTVMFASEYTTVKNGR